MEPLGSVTQHTQNSVFIVDIQHVFNEEIRSVGKAITLSNASYYNKDFKKLLPLLYYLWYSTASPPSEVSR